MERGLLIVIRHRLCIVEPSWRLIRYGVCCSTAGATKASTTPCGSPGGWCETFGAELHVVYTMEEPLSAGWTAEMAAEKLPELHQAVEAEARERLARVIPGQQDTVTIAIRTGDPAAELARYTAENTIDLAIVQRSRRTCPGAAGSRPLLGAGSPLSA